jgi:hypothetical protein
MPDNNRAALGYTKTIGWLQRRSVSGAANANKIFAHATFFLEFLFDNSQSSIG